jgi:hypothetical protein
LARWIFTRDEARKLYQAGYSSGLERGADGLSFEAATAMLGDSSLTELFTKYGTDKVRNEYVSMYENLLTPVRDRRLHICEIGIGTLIPEAPSSMAGFCDAHYQPGGSLRAFRDYCPRALILGLDVQPDTQFSGERIETGLCDSTDGLSVAKFFAHRERTFDLVIDDGLHAPWAQLATLVNFQDKVVHNGAYVIEDIFHDSPVFSEWREVSGDRFELVERRVNALLLRRKH